jgi:hypothetical protein
MVSLSGLRVLQQGIRIQQKRWVSVIKQGNNQGNFLITESYFIDDLYIFPLIFTCDNILLSNIMYVFLWN